MSGVNSGYGGYAGNNYGFGSSNISSAISAHPAMNTTPTPLQSAQTQISQAQTSSSWSDGINNVQSFGIGNHVNTSGVMIGQQDNNMSENNNSIIRNISTHNPIRVGYNIGQKIGEFAADKEIFAT